MTLPLFFKTVPAEDVGIDRLSIGCDQSLDEPNPVVMLRGDCGTVHTNFDHVAAAFSAEEYRSLLMLVERGLESPQVGPITKQEGHHVVKVLERAFAIADCQWRVRQIVDRLEINERFALDDEGQTTIQRILSTDGNRRYAVGRWGGTVVEGVDGGQAVAVALHDFSLPYTSGPLGGEPDAFA